MRTDVRYVVKDEHTLGYLIESSPTMMGVLASLKSGHNPMYGPVSILPGATELRSATVKDFEVFRVAVPPDFIGEQPGEPEIVSHQRM